MQLKKLQYQYFDLYRLSLFKDDIGVCKRAEGTLRLIKKCASELNSAQLSQDKLLNMGFDEISIKEIIEFEQTAQIAFVKFYKQQIDDWLKLLILPDFLNLPKFRSLILKNDIRSANQLLQVISSVDFIKKIGVEKSETLNYFIKSMLGDGFPSKYQHRYNESDTLLLTYCGFPIRGNFHNHTVYSDGKCSISQIKDLANNAQREYIGISDHTKALNGVDEVIIQNQANEINFFNDGNIKILKGVECEILSDGKLDLPDVSLSSLDYVIAGVHGAKVEHKKISTERLIRAIEHPMVNILAHPSSRIYNKNAGLFIDMYKIIDACAENNVTLEINGDPDRLDLDPKYISYALNRDVFFTLDSDTHSILGFKNINNAIEMARDNNIPPERILNLKKLEELNF